MTNPDNAIGTNAAYGGRTSVNARNDVLGLFSGRGVLSGWACSPDSGMTVVLGGDGSTRDVAIVEDASGNRTTVDNISGSPVPVTLPAAPASNSRIDSIVAYVNNPPSGSATVIDNPEACGIIAVSGTASSSPQAPNDTAIRQAITADGASGSTAYYVVLANVTVDSGTTDIVADNIAAGSAAIPAAMEEKVYNALTNANTSNVQSRYVKFRKQGAIITGNFNINWTANISIAKYSSYNLNATVPVEFRPLVNSVFVPCLAKQQSNAVVNGLQFRVNTDGTLTLTNFSNTDMSVINVVASFAYTVDNGA